MKYLPLSEQEKQEKLQLLGLAHADELFRSVPREFLLQTSDRLNAPLSELEIRQFFKTEKSKVQHSFMGGNGHQHYIPSVIDPIISRGEFLTAYTPYQPEISQGTLQAMYEYQSMMAEITGCEVSNASLYDGSTAMLEACAMACRITGRHHVLFSDQIHPEYLECVATYSAGHIYSSEGIGTDARTGKLDQQALERSIAARAGDTAALVIQSPNYLGIVEEISRLASIVHSHGILLVCVVTEAMSMGLLKAPGSLGADIVCGEAQSFGIPLSFGGPWLGFIATSMNNVRNLPGRIVGQSTDKNGKRAFVITLSAREQHIRREKATSNICTNQGLMALRCAIYLGVMGKSGLRRAAERSARFAHYARRALVTQVSAAKVLCPDAAIFNEFVIETPIPAAELFDRCVERYGIAVGTIAGKNRLLCAFDETMSVELIGKWVNAIAACIKS